MDTEKNCGVFSCGILCKEKDVLKKKGIFQIVPTNKPSQAKPIHNIAIHIMIYIYNILLEPKDDEGPLYSLLLSPDSPQCILSLVLIYPSGNKNYLSDSGRGSS